MRYEARDIITENGLCYQVWSIEEAPRPVSCLYTKAAYAVKFMQRMNDQSNGQQS